MSLLSRRTFITGSAAMLPVASSLFARDPLRESNLGVQLYTVRNTIEKQPVKDLEAIQSIGYTEVEIVFATLDKIWTALKETKLRPVSAHVDTAIFMEGGGHLDSALTDLKQRGFEYAVVPYIPPAQRGGADVFKHLAATFNKAGERAKAIGLTLCYHNHAFEFEPVGNGTGLEILMNETQKDLVSLEMDIFWVSVAGHDPVTLLKTYSGRVPLLHLKDKAPGLAVQYNETVPAATFKEIGNGSINIPAVLSAANKAGVRHYFVEQDQSPNPLASLRQSYEYLSSRFKT